ncbi:CYIR protein [Plasmodium cynomolgi strain B]|uniref:CYIR protein n=1 Tax=Plasmodium cynomolgi (strain B) TaxID=1120755 RepID=K6VJ47_PLACD|nr:CYIR protein [Plasmodium cynomolgi strain B]GAB69417.1 CYIR protein [Plasmodium cynomolgi strain B]
MAKPSNNVDLENALKKLKHDKLYDDFFEYKNQSQYNNYCDVFDSKGEKKNEDAKKICPKLVYFLEKIAKMQNKVEGDERCRYLRYWLYDEVGKFHTESSINMDKLSYITDLIEVGNKVNKEKLNNRCSLPSHDKSVKLDEWKNRKISYIYLKKYNDIKKDIDPTNKDKCNMYTTYLNNMNSLYNKYKKECKSIFLMVYGPDYADCYSTHKPDELIALLKNCNKSTGGGSTGTTSWLLNFFIPSNRSSSGNQHKTTQGTVKVADTAGQNTEQGASQGVTRSTSSASSVIAAPERKQVGREMSVTINPKAPLSPLSRENPGNVVNAVRSSASETSSDAGAVITTTVSSTLETLNEKSDKNYIRDVIMATAILGTIFFVFFYNMFQNKNVFTHSTFFVLVFWIKVKFSQKKTKKKLNLNIIITKSMKRSLRSMIQNMNL